MKNIFFVFSLLFTSTSFADYALDNIEPCRKQPGKSIPVATPNEFNYLVQMWTSQDMSNREVLMVVDSRLPVDLKWKTFAIVNGNFSTVFYSNSNSKKMFYDLKKKALVFNETPDRVIVVPFAEITNQPILCMH